MKLYKRKNSKNWYLRQGETLISLKTTRKAYALQLLEEYQAKRLGIYRVPHKRIEDFIEPYLEHCRKRKHNKETTVDDKERTLKYFVEYASNPWLREVTKEKVEKYLDSRIGSRSKEPISADRYCTERQVLNNFFNYLIGEHMLKENPCNGVEKKKIVKNKAKFSLSLVQEALLDKYLASGDDWRADDSEMAGERKLSTEMKQELARVKAVAVNTGLRARELVNVWWNKDIDWERVTIGVSEKPDWKPKDYEERRVPLNKLALQALRDQKMKRGILSRYVFCRQDGKKYGRGLDVAMCRAFIWAGFDSGGLHTLRHTFATRYLQKGGNLEDLRDLMGHSDIRTTQKYLHGDKDAQRKTVERMGKK